MTDPIEGNSDEVVQFPDPLTLVRRTIRGSRLYAAGLVIVLVVLGVVFRHSLSWGDVATWILAITTLLAFLAAAFAGLVAYFAFQAQSEEVSILKDQEERAAEERRRGQAARVYLTEKTSPEQPAIPHSVQMPGGRAVRGQSVVVTVHNTSQQPVYDLRIHWVDAATKVQAGIEDQRGTLGPSDTAESEREIPGNVTVGQFHAVAYFRDAAGLRWTLTTDGQLQRVPSDLRTGAPSIATGAVA
jgi:hypothetical protein